MYILQIQNHHLHLQLQNQQYALIMILIAIGKACIQDDHLQNWHSRDMSLFSDNNNSTELQHKLWIDLFLNIAPNPNYYYCTTWMRPRSYDSMRCERNDLIV